MWIEFGSDVAREAVETEGLSADHHHCEGVPGRFDGGSMLSQPASM